MLDEIAQMKEKFALEPEEKSMKRDILGHLIEIWTTLDDSRPEKMATAYGSMSEVDMNLIRLHILKLLSMNEEIYNELK